MIQVKTDASGAVVQFREPGGRWIRLGSTPAELLLSSILTSSLSASDHHYQGDQCLMAIDCVMIRMGWDDDKRNVLSAAKAFISSTVPVMAVR